MIFVVNTRRRVLRAENDTYRLTSTRDRPHRQKWGRKPNRHLGRNREAGLLNIFDIP